MLRQHMQERQVKLVSPCWNLSNPENNQPFLQHLSTLAHCAASARTPASKRTEAPVDRASVVAVVLLTFFFSQHVPASVASAHSAPEQTVSAKAAFGDMPSPQYIVLLAGLFGFLPAAHLVLAQVAAQQSFLPLAEQLDPSQGRVFWSFFGAWFLPQKKVVSLSVPSPAL